MMMMKNRTLSAPDSAEQTAPKEHSGRHGAGSGATRADAGYAAG